MTDAGLAVQRHNRSRWGPPRKGLALSEQGRHVAKARTIAQSFRRRNALAAVGPLAPSGPGQVDGGTSVALTRGAASAAALSAPTRVSPRSPPMHAAESRLPTAQLAFAGRHSRFCPAGPLILVLSLLFALFPMAK